MADFRDFDLLNVPLEGTNLIEASAGTGKSYSIAGLFLRLVLERRVPVREILVVTFTQAATEELRDRIRRRLREAAEAFAAESSEEAFLQGLILKCQDLSTARLYLREALRSFDQAAIMTIHGFCRRMLLENAFESGSLFDTELITDQEEIKAEVIEDFWRRHLYNESPLFVQFALRSRFRPNHLLDLVGNRHSHPYLHIIPQVPWKDVAPLEKAFTAALEDVRAAWASDGREAVEALETTDSLSLVSYAKRKIPQWVRGMEGFLSSPGLSLHLPDGFLKFTVREMDKALKKGKERPSHPFFEQCEALLQARDTLVSNYEERLLTLKGELLGYVKRELEARKRKRNVHSYDDLLLHLLEALQGKGGEALARAVRGRFQATLVDEFQDTDPVQYAIFRRVFSRERGLLFLIGDPKQAIYGFRGADVFAYMEAAGDVQSRFTLRENWRSEPGLIRAVNTLFENRPRPFVYRGIGFHPSVPAGERDSEVFMLDGKPDAPFRLWFVEGESGDSIPKGEAREGIHRAVAAEISRLLHLGREGRALVGGRPVREEDIAVLVRRNKEAVRVQEVLSGLRIPSVIYSTGNLFESHEAMELERVLSAVAAPEDNRAIRAALATDMLGLKAEDLEETTREEARWEEWVLRFRSYEELWHGRGFIRMVRRLLSREKVLARLMAFPDGERRCTNLLHLGEVLHQTAVEGKLDRRRLLLWLSEQRSGKGEGPEEHPVRLESDERAVRLVTVHKCKGLEYPIVFCPFGWDGSTLRDKEGAFLFHRGESPSGLTLDLGSEEREENRRQAEKEVLAENLRLLYVSLTRARARCTFVWGRFREAETSAPAYLLYPPLPDEEEDVVARTKEKVLGLEGEYSGGLRELAKKSGGTLRIETPPSGPGEALVGLHPGHRETICRGFSGEIDREWRMTSFSSLVSSQAHAAELADYDDLDSTGEAGPGEIPDTTPGTEPQGIFAFPAGTRAGTFLHELLEHLDFAEEDESAVSRLIRDKLERHGFDLQWEDTLRAMIRKLQRVPLDPGVPELCFSRVPASERLNEMEFYFPLKRMGPQALIELFGREGRNEPPREFPERLGRLDFSPHKGFMKGFMDLVFRYRDRFYLVDWKSNHLGPRVEDYDEQGLASAMQKGYYILQYHIYSLALHRYLAWRLPGYDYETHFGAVLYVFLRGVDPDRGPQYGVHRARPSGRLIRAMEERLIDDSAGLQRGRSLDFQ